MSGLKKYVSDSWRVVLLLPESFIYALVADWTFIISHTFLSLLLQRWWDDDKQFIFYFAILFHFLSASTQQKIKDV